MKTLDFSGINIRWLGHDSFRFDFDGKILYIDPFQVHEKDKADIILITHAHYDHFSIEDIKKISKNETLVACTSDIKEKFTKLVEQKNIMSVVPGKEFNLLNVKIKCVRAYNKDKPFHPKANEWVGYVFEINNVKFYHAGDTDFIPEMEDISADVAFLPVSGTYVMNVEEAVAAARKIMPKIAIPMHYGKIIGTKKDAEKFKELCDFCRVEIMD